MGHGVHVQSAVTQDKGQGHGVAPIPALNMAVTRAVEMRVRLTHVSFHHVQVINHKSS